ncbi:MAG: hypothetical protein KF773_20915 [Deltaproteobacteria bacterium]|nr:hypothetical protein [Deltaproteobacteria bacterium]MCW5805778.1 hypothetical protein [Deltaproteobacteria bacterium]
MRFAPIALIAAGILGASSIIIAKKPDARKIVDAIAPYQAFLGLGLLFWGLYNLFVWVGIGGMVKLFSMSVLLGITAWGAVGSGIVLGFLFGLPQVAKWSASGAARGELLAKKLAPMQTILGFVAIGSGVLLLMYNLNILKA